MGYALSADGCRVAIFGGQVNEGRICVWRLGRDAAPVLELNRRLEREGPVAAAQFSSDGGRLATVVAAPNEPPAVTLWDLVTQAPTKMPPSGRPYVPEFPVVRSYVPGSYWGYPTLDPGI